jgi:hypothetical protein
MTDSAGHVAVTSIGMGTVSKLDQVSNILKRHELRHRQIRNHWFQGFSNSLFLWWHGFLAGGIRHSTGILGLNFHPLQEKTFKTNLNRRCFDFQEYKSVLRRQLLGYHVNLNSFKLHKLLSELK